MSLSRNDALSLYNGGPSRHGQRRFVTVREPAKGFFIAGSCIPALNGLYGMCRIDSQLRHQLRRPPQLAYINGETDWLLVLSRSTNAYSRRLASLHTANLKNRYRRNPLVVQSDSEEDTDACSESEWCLIDNYGMERFSHEGDTVIPGAGHRWKHLHRPRHRRPGEKKVSRGSEEEAVEIGHVESLWYDCNEDGYETPAEEGSELASRNDAPPPAFRPCTDLAKVDPDDENELPWQVIAILDASILNDIRNAYVRYKSHIAAAARGWTEKSARASLEGCSIPGSWTYRVVCKQGVDVLSGPSGSARWCDHRAYGQQICACERKGDWIKITQDGTNSHRAVARNLDELWVRLADRQGALLLQVVDGIDGACPLAPPADRLEAESFDRPFEPRLGGPTDDASAGYCQELDRRTGHLDDNSHEHLVPLSLEQFQQGQTVEIHGRVGDAYCNGTVATIVSEIREGFCFVEVVQDAVRHHVSTLWLRPASKSKEGVLGRAARILGVRLEDVTLDTPLTVSSSPSSGPLSAVSRIHAAKRAMMRDLYGAADSKDVQDTGVLNEVRWAHNELLSAIRAEGCDMGDTDSDNFDSLPGVDEQDTPTTNPFDSPASPHAAAESGFLGIRVALSARASADATSAEAAENSAAQLRQCVVDEQRRLAIEAGLTWPVPSSDLPRVPQESSDALRLRLTLVNSLLRCRREEDACREAFLVTEKLPRSRAAKLWLARCFLRLGRRDEGLRELKIGANIGSVEVGKCRVVADDEWGRFGCAARLDAIRRSDCMRNLAEVAYACGSFEQAIELHSKALDALPAEDKWGRAMLLSGRAACHRRARSLGRAVEDCEAALALFPRYTRVHFRRGLCLIELEKPETAIQSFQRVLALDRDWPKLCEWLVRAHAQARRQQRNSVGAGKRHQTKRCQHSDGPGLNRPSARDGPAEGDDLYGVLGVASDATDKQLKQAYRLMSLKYHPDKAGGSTHAFLLIATAHQILSDPEKRKAFDEGTDIKCRKKDNSSSDSEEEVKQSLFEETERRYFPERYQFWPFGDPFIEKRKLQVKRRKQAQDMETRRTMSEDDSSD